MIDFVLIYAQYFIGGTALIVGFVVGFIVGRTTKKPEIHEHVIVEKPARAEARITSKVNGILQGVIEKGVKV